MDAAKEAGADEDASAADEVMGRMASMTPEPHQGERPMTDSDLRKAIVAMFSGGVVNKAAIEELHDRDLIRNTAKGPGAKPTWELTDEGRKFSGLDV